MFFLLSDEQFLVFSQVLSHLDGEFGSDEDCGTQTDDRSFALTGFLLTE